MVFLVLLLAFNLFAAERVKPAPTIIWTFTSSGDKVPSAKSSLITSRHELFRLYYQGLKDYNHSSMTATVPRIEHELRKKRLVCYPGSSEAHRRRQFSYLTPQYIQPSPRLVLRNELATTLAKGGKTISLAEILKNKNLKGVVGKGRSFGPDIDRLLATRPENIQTLATETFSPSFLQMIKNRRADYTIEYQFIVKSLTENNGQFTDIVAMPLSDVEPVMTQYLACSKTRDGLDVVKKADVIIRNNIRKPSYWKGVLDSISSDERPHFQKEIQRFIEKRTKKPVIIE